MLLPHDKVLIEFLSLEDLYGEFYWHERLMVFAQKGRACVSCGREGTLLIIGEEKRNPGQLHIDLYTDNFVLMTVDHIMPKYQAKMLGWSPERTESIDNKQPMCDPCNNSKGCKVMTLEQIQKRRRDKNMPVNSTSIVKQLVPNIHEMLGDYSVITA